MFRAERVGFKVAWEQVRDFQRREIRVRGGGKCGPDVSGRCVIKEDEREGCAYECLFYCNLKQVNDVYRLKLYFNLFLL